MSEPDEFTKYVDQWDQLCGEINAKAAALKEMKDREMIMRKALEHSVSVALGARWREGTNKLPLPDGRVLKVVHSIERKVLDDQINDALEQYQACNDRSVEFYDVVKPKTSYTVSKPALERLSGEALKAVQHCIVSKPAAPKVELT